MIANLSGNDLQIGTELGESGNLTVLSKVELKGTSDRLHELGLSGGSDTGDGHYMRSA
jgi:hypothetical protein